MNKSEVQKNKTIYNSLITTKKYFIDSVEYLGANQPTALNNP